MWLKLFMVFVFCGDCLVFSVVVLEFGFVVCLWMEGFW